MAGAPEGNKNATKNKPWQRALERELTGEKNADKLAQIALKVFEKAVEGDIQAIKEIGDRLDGKSVQSVEGTGANGVFTINISSDDESVL